MFLAPNCHKEKKVKRKRIKIGNKVPKNAVNIAYFKNKIAGDGNEKVVVSEAFKNTIDHISIKEQVTKNCLATKSEKHFSPTFFYSDNNGYEGDIPLNHITWHNHRHFFEEDATITKEYMDLKEQVPPETEIPYSIMHESGIELKGILKLVDIKYIPTKTNVTTNEYIEKRFAEKTIRKPKQNNAEYDFPKTIEHSENGFSGILHYVDQSKRFIPHLEDSKVEFIHTIKSSTAATANKDGHTLPKLSTISTEEEVKIYGFCRYWNSGTTTGYYGNSSLSFTDTYPRKPTDTKFYPNQIRAGNYPNVKNIKEAPEEAKAYMSEAPNNWIWLEDIGDWSAFKAKYGSPTTLAKKIGTEDIVADNLGIGKVQYNVLDCKTAPETIGSGGNISSMKTLYSNVWKRKSGTNCSYIHNDLRYSVYERGAVVNAGQNYFRDCVGFWKGTIGSKKSYYGKNVVKAGKIMYTPEADYKGELTKTVTENNQNAIEWKAIAIFSGTLSGEYIDYNGLATYIGTATKKDSTGSLGNVGRSIEITYPNDNGILYTDLNNQSSCNIKTEFIEITDVFQNNVPLFYSYRLKKKIYLSELLTDFQLENFEMVKLVDSMNRDLPSHKKYKIKLTQSEKENSYYADVFTSFKTNSNNKVFAIYNTTEIDYSKDAEIKEEIFVQPDYQINKQYSMTNVSEIERKNYFTIKDPNIVTDNRRKIEFEYEVVAFDKEKELFVTNPIRAIGINKRFALKGETSKFIDNNHIVSPKSFSGYKTAYEIVSSEFNTDNKIIKYTARLTENPINGSIKNLVNLYTDVNGESPVSAEILADTGFLNPDTNEYNAPIQTNSPYTIYKNKIRYAYAIKKLDLREIRVLHPREDMLLQNWHNGIRFSHFTQLYKMRGIKKKLVYSMPEFDTQDYSVYGRPYIEVKNETPTIIGPKSIKVNNENIYVSLNNSKEIENLKVELLNLAGDIKVLEIASWSYEEGIINLNEVLSETDNLRVSYHYMEDRYIYRGEFKENKFYDIDINTNIYHRYTNNKFIPTTEEVSSKLLNSVIYYFIRPSTIIEDFTEDGELEYKSIYVERFETSSNKEFADKIFVEENEYKGWIPKVGLPFIESGTSGTDRSKIFFKTLKNKDKDNFPNTIVINEEGYNGSIPKLGTPVIADGSFSESQEIELKDSIIKNTQKGFPEYMDLEFQGIPCKAHRVGSPMLLEGEEVSTITQNFELEKRVCGKDEFPKTFPIDEDGFKGAIPKDGGSYYISGEFGEEKTYEFVETKKSQDLKDLPNKIPYTYTLPDGRVFKGEAKATGEPIQIQGTGTQTRKKEFNETKRLTVYKGRPVKFPETIKIDKEGYKGDIPKNGYHQYIETTNLPPYGEEEFHDTDVCKYKEMVRPYFKNMRLLRIEEVKESTTLFSFVRTEHFRSGAVLAFKCSSKYGDIRPNMPCSHCGDTINVYYPKKFFELKEHKYRNGLTRYMPKTVKKSDIWNRKNNGIYKPHDEGIAFEKTTSKWANGDFVTDRINDNIEDFRKMGYKEMLRVEGEYPSFFKKNERESKLPTSFYLQEPDIVNLISGEEWDSIPNHTAIYIGQLETQLDYFEANMGEKYFYKAYYGVYANEGDVKDVFEQKYRGTLTKTFPDDKVFERTYKDTLKDVTENTLIYGQMYKGDLSKAGYDTIMWEQSYKGKVVIPGNDTRSYEQKYQGELTKSSSDTRIWKQKYQGQLKNEGENIKATNAEIVFVIDTNTSMSNIHKELKNKISVMHKNLLSFGLNEVKLGLVLYGNTYTKISFNGDFTTSAVDFCSKLNITAKDGASNSFTASKYVADNYDFTTDYRSIVLMSNREPNDINLMVSTSAACKEKDIKVQVATDTNIHYCKSLIMLANETRGQVGDLENEWEADVIAGIAKVCKIGTITFSTKDTLYHKIDDNLPNHKNDILIGSTFMRHYTSLQATKIVDARSLGGGILKTINDELRRELQMETDYYFDIGNFDGEAYCKNGVIIIRLDKRILKENGGLFSETDVYNAVNKWLAQGIVPIIEYVSVGENIEKLNENLEVEVNNGSDFNYTPNFNISTSYDNQK